LYSPTSIANIFGNLILDIDYKYKILLRVGAVALILSLWLCRNDKVFNDKNCTLLQVIYRCTGTLRIWSQLHQLEDRDLFTEVRAGARLMWELLLQSPATAPEKLLDGV
jgi:hypothetical protein